MINSIRIGGIDYEVKIIPDLRDGDKKLDGCIRYGDCEILLEETLSSQMKHQVLLHEIVHGIFTTLGRELDENAVDAVAHMLLQILRDNPGLAEVINGKN